MSIYSTPVRVTSLLCKQNEKQNKKKTIRYEYNRSRYELNFQFLDLFFFSNKLMENYVRKYKDVRHLLKKKRKKHKKRGRIQKRNFFLFCFLFFLCLRGPFCRHFKRCGGGPTTAGLSAAESEAWNGHSVGLLLLLLLSFIYYTAVHNRYSITHYIVKRDRSWEGRASPAI